ncbi:unnamed protein product [Larinioides sclopetarius]|uniref:Transposase n=1 Tax=Larinioides sclopetarius TaxID=280406 RepID=A0AAV2BMN6_9ARAC
MSKAGDSGYTREPHLHSPFLTVSPGSAEEEYNSSHSRETGSVLDKERSGRPRRSDVTVQDIREAFARSPTQSISRSSRDLGVARSTAHNVLRKGLNFPPSNVQLLQVLNPGGLNCRFNFAIDMLERIDADFLRKIIFIDEATFHLSGTVNR